MSEASRGFKDIVILGIGNLVRSDEGVGVWAVRKITAAHRLAAHVRPIDGGVLGLDLLGHLSGCDALLILDAVDVEQPPGTVVRLDGDALDISWKQKFSMHQAGVFDMLVSLQLSGETPPHVVVFGVQPLTLDWGTELSPPVAASLDKLVTDAVAELRSWGAIVD